MDGCQTVTWPTQDEYRCGHRGPTFIFSDARTAGVHRGVPHRTGYFTGSENVSIDHDRIQVKFLDPDLVPAREMIQKSDFQELLGGASAAVVLIGSSGDLATLP